MITRGNESYRRLLLKGFYILLRMPRLWPAAVRVLGGLLSPFSRGAAASGKQKNPPVPAGRESSWLYRKFFLKFFPGFGSIFYELGKRMRLAAGMIQCAFPLVFTSPGRPLGRSPGPHKELRMGLRMIRELEALVKKRLQTVPLGQGNVYRRLKAPPGRKEAIENIAYFSSILLTPLLGSLHRHYRTGRETMPPFDAALWQEVRGMLRLLRAGETVRKDDENQLLRYLYRDDPWLNYFAVAVLVIHGNTHFSCGRRIMERLLEQGTGSAGAAGEDGEVAGQLRIYRQYFTIHTFILRRAEGEELLEQVGESLAHGLDIFYNQLDRDPALLSAFIRSGLDTRGEPFNPLLPVGIYQARRGGGPGRNGEKETGQKENGISGALGRMRQLGSGLSREMRKKLAERLWGDLVSLSLFYPRFALSAGLESFRRAGTDDPETAAILVDKIYVMDLLLPGHFETTGGGASGGNREIKKRLNLLKESGGVDFTVVEHHINQLRLLAWYEFLTTVMVSYPVIRDLVLRVVSQGLRGPVSLPFMVQRLIGAFLNAYFTPPVNESLENFFPPPPPPSTPPASVANSPEKKSAYKIENLSSV